MPADGLAENLLGQSVRVDVRGVDQVDAGVQAHADLPFRAVEVGRSNGARPARPAERHGAEGEHRNPQPRVAELPILHRRS